MFTINVDETKLVQWLNFMKVIFCCSVVKELIVKYRLQIEKCVGHCSLSKLLKAKTRLMAK